MRQIILYFVMMTMVTACGGRVDFMQRQMVNPQVAMADYKVTSDDSDEITEPQEPSDNNGNNNNNETGETTETDKVEEIINPPDSGDLEGSIVYPDGGDKDSGGTPTTGGGSIIDNLIPGGKPTDPVVPETDGGDGGGEETDPENPDIGDGGDVTDPENPDTGEGGGETEENYRLPMVQRYDIQLKDGRHINVSTADVILDNDILQIRQEGDLMFKGLQPKNTDIARAGLLKDLSNGRIYPVVAMETASVASSIPKGGTWGGGWEDNFYGEFQGEKYAYDVFGIAEAKVKLAQDRIEGSIDWLTYRPADTTLPVDFLDGRITFDGTIKNQEWVGSAQSHGLKNPESGQDFSESLGFTEGVFASPIGEEATHAMGHVTLIDDDNQGLTGVMNMEHMP